MSDRGWCPFARQHRGYRVEGPFGYPAGERDQNYPLLFLDHRMGGYKRTLDDDVWRYANWVGVTAGIGRDGSLDQYCSIFDAHWGNGISGDITRFDRSNPRLAALEARGVWIPRPLYSRNAKSLDAGGVNVLNAGSIATENEDENQDRPWPAAQIETNIRWKRWCIEELIREGRPMTIDEHMQAGHFQIDAVNRPGCPGENWPKAEMYAGISAEEEEDVKPFLVFEEGTPNQWLVGFAKPVLIGSAAEAASLAAAYGPPKITLSKGTLDQLTTGGWE